MIDLANETQTARSEKTDLKTQLAEVAERIRTMRYGAYGTGDLRSSDLPDIFSELYAIEADLR